MLSGNQERFEKILVCFAVKEEAGKSVSRSPDCTVLVTGMGHINAERCIRSVLTRTKFNLVLTCGFAGGLNPNLKTGTVVYDQDAQLNLLAGTPETVQAKFHCADRVLITVSEKKLLWESTRADVVEMESSVIRAVAHEHNIPSATIRVISDSADENLPLDFNALMTPDKKINFPKLLGGILLAPQKIPALLSFQRQTSAAATKLDIVLSQLLGLGG